MNIELARHWLDKHNAATGRPAIDWKAVDAARAVEEETVQFSDRLKHIFPTMGFVDARGISPVSAAEIAHQTQMGIVYAE